MNKFKSLLVILLLNCQCSENNNFIEGASSWQMWVFKITYPQLIKVGKELKLDSEKALIDSTSYLLDAVTIDSIFKDVIVSKPERQLMPVVGDGLAYHAVMSFVKKGISHKIYLFRVASIEGFYRDENGTLYTLKFTKRGREIVDKKINCCF